jgi:hypothetical protein
MAASPARSISSAVLLACLALAWSSAAGAAKIDILANHSATDPAGQTIINGTDDAGTTDLNENSNRGIANLLDDQGISGNPFSQAAQLSDPSAAYWNNQGGRTRGDLGILIDLGAVYTLDAMQLFGYNISDPGSWGDRSPDSFSIWTASSGSAVTTGGGVLLVSDIGQFTQQGGTQGMSDPGASATLGETYLFGGASQPSEVGGTTHAVTGSSVDARYVFLRGLTPIETNPTDLNIVGLGEVQFYGTAVPEPSTLALGILAGLTLVGGRRRLAA